MKESVKITYGVNDFFKSKRKITILPFRLFRAKKEIAQRKAAAEALRGIWEDKDDNFFAEQ